MTSGALVDAGGRPCVDGWPTNPYTLAPMAAGNGPGDYEYSRTANGFEITAFGAAGQPIITVP